MNIQTDLQCRRGSVERGETRETEDRDTRPPSRVPQVCEPLQNLDTFQDQGSKGQSGSTAPDEDVHCT